MGEFWRHHLEREYKRHHQKMHCNGNSRKNYLLFWSHKWPTEVERVAQGHIYENFGTSVANLSFFVSEIQLFENDLWTQIRFQPQILMNPYYCVMSRDEAHFPRTASLTKLSLLIFFSVFADQSALFTNPS